MGFQFRLQSVLALRQHDRELRRQPVSEARANLGKRVLARNVLADARMAVLNELRRLNDSAKWDINQVIRHQRHAHQLGCELARAEASVIKAQTDLETCLAVLVIADQSVRALEKLAERQFADFQESQARAMARG